MRNADRRWKTKAWASAVIFALVLLFVLFGCDSTGAGGSNDGNESDSGENGESESPDEDGESESPGEAFDLPEGDIANWDLGTRTDVVVNLVDADRNPVGGYGPITVEDDGHFPGMTIDPPPTDALLSWEDFTDVYEFHLFSLPVDITDDTVRFQTFCCLDVYTAAVIVRGTEDETVEINWIYADGPTNISISNFNTGDYVATIDLQLSTGWNRAVFQSDATSASVTLETGAEPAGTEWRIPAE